MADMQPLVRDNIRLAATVMLVRDGKDGLEVYMVQRPGRGDFPDLHVFPGGKVDAEDWAPELCLGFNDDNASRQLGLEAGGLRYWVAVVRECFEECGVLLAYRNGKPLEFAQAEERHRFEEYRRELLEGELNFPALCQREQLTIAWDRLAYFSHWLTPEVAPRRFDTRFFVAAMPEDQHTLAHTSETADDDWEVAGKALARHAAGQWQMIDPTLRSLETLTEYENVATLLAGVGDGNHLMPLTTTLRAQGMQPLR